MTISGGKEPHTDQSPGPTIPGICHSLHLTSLIDDCVKLPRRCQNRKAPVVKLPTPKPAEWLRVIPRSPEEKMFPNQYKSWMHRWFVGTGIMPPGW